MLRRFSVAALLVTGMLLDVATTAFAQEATLAAPTLTPVAAGQGKVRVTVEAGVDGAPSGFTVWWMPRSRFDSFGADWANVPASARRAASFVGEATLNTWGDPQQSFQLNGYGRLDVEVGDLADESGVIGQQEELAPAEEWVITAFSNGSELGPRGLLALTVGCVTKASGTNCTYTLGYWKTHAEAWPVNSLTLGTVSYTKSQLLSILSRPVQGNGLISLAHQLIAAKLNVAAGASPTSIAGTISSADALIAGRVVPPVGSGSLTPSSTSVVTQGLDDFNNGLSGPGHCGTTAATAHTWGSLKTLYR